jgi:hypothetical protein
MAILTDIAPALVAIGSLLLLGIASLGWGVDSRPSFRDDRR